MRQSSSTATPNPSPGLVLLVDQHPTNWLGTLLSDRGHRIVRLEDGSSALQRIAEEDPDLVVIDADLPAADATAICHAVRDLTALPPPVVIESATVLGLEDQRRLLRAGAWECLTPTAGPDADPLVHRLETYLRVHRDSARARLGLSTDPRTGLYTRVGLTRRARELGAQAFRTHESLACAVFDIVLTPDSEEAAVQVARVMRDEARLSDIVAQLGDREVALLASRTDHQGIVRLAERIARAVRRRATPPDATLELRGCYDAVASVGYAPVQPLDLVTSAAASLRARPRSEGGQWLRRSTPPRPDPTTH